MLTLSIVARLIWQRVDLNATEMSHSTNKVLTENYLVSLMLFILRKLACLDPFYNLQNHVIIVDTQVNMYEKAITKDEVYLQ